MRELLENYTYEQFQKDMKPWLTSGRMLWGFFGNLSTEVALDTVNRVRDLIKLETTAIADLKKMGVLNLPVGEQRVDF